MVLPVYQGFAVDELGNVLPSAQVTIRRETSGAPLAVPYRDRDGTLADVGNPFNADADGFFRVYLASGAYRVDIVSGSTSRTLRHVAVGLAAETDSAAAGVAWQFDVATTDSDPGPGYFRLNNSTPGSATEIYVDDLDFLNTDQSSWIETFDDQGSSSDRGTIVIRAGDQVGFLVATVTGTITDNGGYYTIPITVLSATAASTFVQDVQCGILFSTSGTDGLFDGTETQVTAAAGDLIPLQDVSDSNNPKRAAASTIGAGRQTIWVPAEAMTPRASFNPCADLAVLTGSSYNFNYLAFDPNTDEFAYFNITMPPSWDAGTLKVQFFWTHPSTATNFDVVWDILANSFSNDDTLSGSSFDVATITDTGGTTNDLYISGETSDLDPTGTPSPGDLIHFLIRRDANGASDNMTVDAYLIGVRIFYNTTANTDD